MTPRNLLRKMLPWGREKKDGKESAATSPVIQTIPHPSPARTLAGDKPQAQVTHAASTEPEPHEQPAPTASAAPTPRPPPAPAASPRDGSPDTLASTPPIPPEPLWNRAYDALKEEDHELVDTYEKLLSRGLEGDPGSTDLTLQKNDIEQENPAERRSQMTRLVEAGLKKIENEATVKQSIEKRMLPLSSAKRVIDTAVTASPEASLAWAGVCCVLQILKNPVTETSANRDGIAYIISRIDWYHELSKLLFQESKDETSLAGLRDELKKHVIDLYKLLLSYQMKSVCSYFRHRGIVFVWDMITPGKWADALQAVHDAEKTVQEDIERHSTEDIKSHLRDLVESAKYLQEELLPGFRQALQDQTTALREMRQDDKNEKCLSDLLSTHPRDDMKRIERTKGGLLKDSYQWILQHSDFRRWHDDDQPRLLWVRGDPGKGKTMLLMGIINELEQQLIPAALAYFFCQGTDSHLNNATAVLRGLVYLLVMQQPLLISHLRERYDHQRGLFQDKNAFVALSEMFEAMLRDPKLARAYIVIDALDECETNRKQLLNLIARNISASPLIKWIVSSRNVPEIVDELCLGKEMQLRLELADNAKQVSRAVNAYIDTKISNLRSVQDDAEQRDRVRDIMRQKATGTFLWVALVVQELENVESWDVLGVLEELPPGLDGLYGRMMNQIQQLKRQDPEFCRLVLSAATLAYRPLRLAEMGILSGLPTTISSSQGRVKKIVGKCGSFLKIQDDYVYLIHQSAKDYLSGKASGTIFPSGLTDAHRAMFSRSLQAMSTLRRNIYELNYLGPPIGEIKAPDPDPLAAMRYSCIYWVDHLCNRDDDTAQHRDILRDGGAVHQFFSHHFLHWLEALSLSGAMSDGVFAVARLEKLLMEQSPNGQLLSLVQDAHRFILHNKWVVENAPLQTYSSALIFSPVQSLIRAKFKKEEPAWITTAPIMESNWGPCIQTLVGHEGPVNSVAFSCDSSLLATGSDDNTIKIWEAATGKEVQTLRGHGDSVNSVAFSGDSKLIASGSDDETIKIWDATTGKEVQTFSGDSKLIASGSDDETIKIWDATTGKEVQTLEVGTTLNSISFDTTSSYLLTDVGSLRLNGVYTGEEAQTQAQASPQEVPRQGYGLSSNREWISWNGHTLLWLPPDYRPSRSAVSSSSIAIGCQSGRVITLGFSGSPVP
ncbi:hypothetical protein FOTG_18735 [Fusarium oxysporum f. sp. vasinfectum 25433]|uniref:NACHT domain-containing protein n=1 Tax=Fusarium oxysporum f. sp. vasinfectum 25433 TaxID=1089449 RepID=X0KVT9_FUSOX|nr:hypothetical protein FOTG_18735 [Fusarium oxysporum f. sp. vasinfectum 25433]